MRVSRLQIKNFRNFKNLDVVLGEHAVIVGENKVGKSNLLFALRLLLDPSLPDSARQLSEDDFWDGLARPLRKKDEIKIAVDLADFDDNENQLALLCDHLVKPDPMVARLTYTWQPIAGLRGRPRKDADYEFLLYGGERPENRIGYELRRRLPLELLPALRDCEGDLQRWTRSPLRPLLDEAAAGIERARLEAVAEGVDTATAQLGKIKEVKDVAQSIANKLTEMVGQSQALDTELRFSPTEPDKLIRALRIFIDGGRRGVSDASLGSANLLYFALNDLENGLLVESGERDHTFTAIEEPEAHLHPTLQRLIFRNYLRPRQATQDELALKSSTILMTTHSPHIASVTPLRHFVVLRTAHTSAATDGISTADLGLSDEDVADLERYMDANRGELLFSRGVILVEGDAERFLIPVLARQRGFDLDQLGLSVCSVSGTNFAPYLRFLGPAGLDVPLAALTDHDPRRPSSSGASRHPLGPRRIVGQMLPELVNLDGDEDFDDLLGSAAEHGIFSSEHTFEVDLFAAGLHEAFAKAMGSVAKGRRVERMETWAASPADLDVDRFLKDIEAVGKGRFAQRLASVVLDEGLAACPQYVIDGVTHVATKVQTS